MILVTGGAGFIGSHIAAALAARGERVVVRQVAPGGRGPAQHQGHGPVAGGALRVGGHVLSRYLRNSLRTPSPTRRSHVRRAGCIDCGTRFPIVVLAPC